MRRLYPAVVALTTGCSALFGVATAAAADGWRLTGSDFTTREVELQALDDDQIRVRAGTADQTLAADDVVQLVRVSRSAVPDARFILHLRNGDRLRGNVAGLGDSLDFDVAGLDPVRLPAEQLRALTPDALRYDRPPSAGQPATDEVTLANGDRLVGFLTDVDGNAWTLAAEDGGNVEFAGDAVAGVRFADTGLPPPAVVRAWRVRTTDGSVLTADALTWTDDRVTFDYFGQTVELPASRIEGLERQAGRVLWLSRLAPTEVTVEPFLTAEVPVQIDAVADPRGGGPRRGFILPSRTIMSFDLPPGYTHLRSRLEQVGGDLGDADVSVRLDDEVAWSLEGLRTDTPQTLDVALGGATRLTLVVDYGRGMDVQDRVAFLDAALVRCDD